METITTNKNINKLFENNYQQRQLALNGESSLPYNQIQQSAYRSFAKNGFPSVKNEEWKYTPVWPRLQPDFELNPIVHGEWNLNQYFPDEPVNRLVFINGRYRPEYSVRMDNSPGLVIGSFAEARKFSPGLLDKYFASLIQEGQSPFGDLNTAFCEDGLFVHLPNNYELEYPLYVLHLSISTHNASFHNPRHLIILGESSLATIFEQYVDEANSSSFENIASEIILEHNAHLHHIQLTDKKSESSQVLLQEIKTCKDSKYTNYNFQINGKLLRSNIHNRLAASNSEVNLLGVYLPSQDQLMDNHTIVDHIMPHAHSNELYKGIIKEGGVAVFNGKIFVRPDAQKTNAYQTNRNILLDNESTINTKPQLEIWADDVKCSHGTTTGQLDDHSIFYLQARGIGKEMAKKMLLEAFVMEITDSIPNPTIQAAIRLHISNKLG